jgi:hypothetical protein
MQKMDQRQRVIVLAHFQKGRLSDVGVIQQIRAT